MSIWDIFICAGCGMIFIWFVWVVVSGRRIKVKDNFSAKEAGKAVMKPYKKMASTGKFPSTSQSKRHIQRASFLKKRIEKDKELVDESTKLLRSRGEKRFWKEFEDELKKR